MLNCPDESSLVIFALMAMVMSYGGNVALRKSISSLSLIYLTVSSTLTALKSEKEVNVLLLS